MNIQSIYASPDASPVAAVSSPASAEASPSIDPDAGSATALWVSPPGLFFSVLHQVSQAYPLELKAALASALGQDATAEAIGRTIVSSRTAMPPQGEVPSDGSAALAPGGNVVRARLAPGHSLHQLMGVMSEVAQQSPTSFAELAPQVAASFAVVASAATGAGADAMADLASQLNQAARMGGGDARIDPPAQGDARRVDAVRPVSPISAVGGDGFSSSRHDPEG